MKIAEATEHMTKWYLQRVVDSFTKDFPKPDEERAREIIVGNTEELTAHDRIAGQEREETESAATSSDRRFRLR